MNYQVTEFLRFLARFIVTIFQVLKDGKVNFRDIPSVLRLLPVIKPAFQDLDAVYDGFRDLDKTQTETLAYLVADELGTELTDESREACELMIDTATTLIQTIVKLKGFKLLTNEA